MYIYVWKVFYTNAMLLECISLTTNSQLSSFDLFSAFLLIILQVGTA
jgi:hypothetical protein